MVIAAYPWNWCPVVSQEKNQQGGFAFEIGPRGELGLKAFLDGQWQECVSQTEIPLKKWVHIAATFHKSNGMAIFINGNEAGLKEVEGEILWQEDADFQIGMSAYTRKPAFIHREHGTLPAWYSLDAILDELKIYGTELSEAETSARMSVFG